MEEQKKRNPLETEKEGKLIAKFASPAIISMLVICGVIIAAVTLVFLNPLLHIFGVTFPLYMGIDGVMYAGPIADAAAGIVAIGFALKELRAMDEIA